MRFRKLRIAWSVGFGLLAALLIVLWVRSYYSEDFLNIQLPARTFSVWQLRGNSVLTTTASPGPLKVSTNSVSANSPIVSTKGAPQNRIGLGFSGVTYRGGFFVTFPNWFPVMVSATFAVAMWFGTIPRRFSLRTLLTATTLVAVVLGLIVAIAR